MRRLLLLVRALGPWPWAGALLALVAGGAAQAYAVTGAGLFRMAATFGAVLSILCLTQVIRRALLFDGYLRLARALAALSEAGGRWRQVPPIVPHDPGALLVEPPGAEPWALAVEPLEARVRGPRARARLLSAAGRARVAAAWAAAADRRPGPPQAGILCLLRRAGPPVAGVPQFNPEDLLHLGRAASAAAPAPVTRASAPAPPAPPPANPMRS